MLRMKEAYGYRENASVAVKKFMTIAILLSPIDWLRRLGVLTRVESEYRFQWADGGYHQLNLHVLLIEEVEDRQHACIYIYIKMYKMLKALLPPYVSSTAISQASSHSCDQPTALDREGTYLYPSSSKHMMMYSLSWWCT